MKFILLFLFPIVGFAQSKLEKISLIDNKVEILAPKELSKMTDQMWTFKYHNNPKATVALSDANAEVNLIVNYTPQPAAESQMGDFKDFQIAQLKKTHPDLKVLEDGVKTINGKKVGFFKFLSQASDQKVFNYYFFTVLDGKVLL